MNKGRSRRKTVDNNLILSNLSPNGYCFLEINEAYGEELMQLYEDLSFDSVVLKKDIFNKNRMIKIKKK